MAMFVSLRFSRAGFMVSPRRAKNQTTGSGTRNGLIATHAHKGGAGRMRNGVYLNAGPSKTNFADLSTQIASADAKNSRRFGFDWKVRPL